jgi:protein-tyrosine kinase
MKIRKAIEKARRARQGLLTPGSVTKEVKEWKAPVYTESRHVNLDREVLERNRCVAMFPDSPYLTAYKILRTQIQKRIMEKDWNSLMITSAVPGEGKTLTAVNLAGSFALEFDKTVLLMDCDFQRQEVHKILGISSDKNLVDYLVDGVALKDLIIWPGIDRLTLISGHRTIQESTELLASPGMKLLVEEVKTRYQDRFVIFDVPPVLAGADAIAFAMYADCVIMVVEMGRTSMQDVERALELIPKEKFLGFVLNRDDFPGAGSYGYYY